MADGRGNVGWMTRNAGRTTGIVGRTIGNSGQTIGNVGGQQGTGVDDRERGRTTKNARRIGGGLGSKADGGWKADWGGRGGGRGGGLGDSFAI